MNVICVPEQMVLPGLAAILTDGATGTVTVILTAFAVIVAGVAQAALLVNTQVTISPFTKPIF